MRCVRPVVLIASLLLAPACLAQAVHKCRDAEGVIAYQDKPCREAEALPAPRIDPPPPPSAIAPVPAMPVAANASPPPAAPAPPPPPQQFLCSTFEGKSYVSGNGNPPARMVPLAAMNLAERRYQRGDITRRGNGEVAPPPRADMYVEVRDQCAPMSQRQLCNYWYRRLGENSHARKLAFNDERPGYEQEERTLRTQLQTYCGY